MAGENSPLTISAVPSVLLLSTTKTALSGYVWASSVSRQWRRFSRRFLVTITAATVSNSGWTFAAIRDSRCLHVAQLCQPVGDGPFLFGREDAGCPRPAGLPPLLQRTPQPPVLLRGPRAYVDRLRGVARQVEELLLAPPRGDQLEPSVECRLRGRPLLEVHQRAAPPALPAPFLRPLLPLGEDELPAAVARREGERIPPVEAILQRLRHGQTQHPAQAREYVVQLHHPADARRPPAGDAHQERDVQERLPEGHAVAAHLVLPQHLPVIGQDHDHGALCRSRPPQHLQQLPERLVHAGQLSVVEVAQGLRVPRLPQQQCLPGEVAAEGQPPPQRTEERVARPGEQPLKAPRGQVLPVALHVVDKKAERLGKARQELPDRPVRRRGARIQQAQRVPRPALPAAAPAGVELPPREDPADTLGQTGRPAHPGIV